MPNLFRRLLDVLAGSTRDDLRRQVQYLKAENEILRVNISGPVRLEPEERARLVKLGKPLGQAIETIISIVRPETFLRWVWEADKVTPRRKGSRKPGRAPTNAQLIEANACVVFRPHAMSTARSATDRLGADTQPEEPIYAR